MQENIKKGLSEIIVALDAIEDQKLQIKAICDNLKTVVEPALLKRVAKAVQKDRRDVEIDKITGYLELLEGVQQ